jgi:hypothetical protein
VSEQPPNESFRLDLPTFEWNQDQSVAYEVAIEVIGEAVGAYTAAIHRERAKPEPDQEKIARWLEGQAACVAERKRLRSTDDAEVARVRREYHELAQAIDAEAR